MNSIDKSQIKDTIESVHRYRDHAMWDKIEDHFVAAPFVDDRALTSDLPGIRKVSDVISGWKNELRSYFYATRHRIRSTKIKISSAREATAIAPTMGQYFITDRGERYVLTVNGTYHYNLVKRSGKWKIGKLKFILKGQTLKLIGA